MRYNYEERKALAEANRVVNDAVNARNRVAKEAEERYQKSERERAAKQRERDASWAAVKARLAADKLAAEAKAQRSFEERVDAFTEDLKRSLAEHDLKFIGGWVKSEFSMVPPTYQGTHVELASTTSEHKATLRVQIGQGLKR